MICFTCQKEGTVFILQDKMEREEPDMNNNLWYYWAKRLHIVDGNNRDWYGYCDDISNECDLKGDSIILETKSGYKEFFRSNIRLIECA